ncbi:MAG: AbrB/MazE/SpoVT family DNA-binding domain-containing protein [Steroidobacteraceae bacterium]
MTESLMGSSMPAVTRVTGKFQITLPKRLVDAYGIRVGDEVEVVAAGESIAIRPAKAGVTVLSPEERLRHFDAATRRQEERQRDVQHGSAEDRGWTREELYPRGRPR